MQAYSTLRNCTLCSVTSNSDASLQRHLQSKAHRAASQRAASAVAPSVASAAAAPSVAALCAPLPSPVTSSSSPLAEPPSNLSRATAAAASAAAVPATAVVAAPVTSSTYPRAPLASPVDIIQLTRQPLKASKSSKQQDGNHELVEADGHGRNSSKQQAHSQLEQLQQQQSSYACRICDVQCPSSANLRDHVRGAAHAKSEQAFRRGMHAALDYLSVSLSSAPAPPTAVVDAAAGSDSVGAVAMDVLTADGEVNPLFLTAANPAVRAMCDSLRAHEQGGAWRSFLAAVRAGMGEMQQWSSAFAVRQQMLRLADGAEEDHPDECDDDEDDFGYDDEEY